MRKYLLLILLSLLFLLCFGIYQYVQFNDGKLHIVVCDVGQGDGILIRTPSGKNFIIDAGPDDSFVNCMGQHLPFWDRDIAVMILTHPHADHLTGMISVLQQYNLMHYATERVGNTTAVYKHLQEVLAQKNLTTQYLWSGNTFTNGNVHLITVWPDKAWFDAQPEFSDADATGSAAMIGEHQSLDVNGFSVIEEITYGNFKGLFTGDAGSAVEHVIAPKVGAVTFLKVPHHGSRTGMSDAFLQNITPVFAIISVGAKNRYGHPSPISLSLLQKYNVKTLRTDKNGTVEIITDGKTYDVKVEK